MSLADKAKLLLIPSGYKAGNVYSVFPTDGDGDFTFSRTGEATRINPGGLIETVTTQVPRIDHSGGGCPSLLLESQRTNIITYSEEFDSDWVKNSCLTDDNYAISPSGELNACRLIDNAVGGVEKVRIYKEFVFNSNTEYTFSCFAKKDQVDYMSLRTAGFDGTGSGSSYFNVANGTLGTIRPDHTAKIEDYRNGWYRCSITFAVTTGDLSGFLSIYANETNNVETSDRDGTTSVFIYGAQLEQSSYPTTYIPTSGGTETRNADSCNVTLPSGIIGQTEGTIFIEYPNINNLYAYIGLSINGSSANRIIFYSIGNSNRLTAQYRQSGTITMLGSSAAINGKVKAAISYSSTESVFYVNGVQVVTGTSSAWSGLNRVEFDHANQIGAKVNDFRIYNTRLTNTELTELTTL